MGANIVADLSALREQYGTERKRVPLLMLNALRVPLLVLTSLRIYSLTRTVWDGAQASTTPSRKRVPLLKLITVSNNPLTNILRLLFHLLHYKKFLAHKKTLALNELTFRYILLFPWTS